MVNKHKEDFQGGFKKKLHSLISCDDLVNGRTYAITLNPNIEVNEFLSLKEFLEKCRNEFSKLNNCKIRLYMEVGKKGRHHFHGFITIIKKVPFVIRDLPKILELGSTVMKDMYQDEYNDNIFDSYLAWLVYCLKDQHYMQEYMVHELVPYTEHDKKTFDKSDVEMTLSTFKRYLDYIKDTKDT